MGSGKRTTTPSWLLQNLHVFEHPSSLSVSKYHRTEEHARKVFPWLLWQIWKAQNSFIFKKHLVRPHYTAAQAYEDAALWEQAQAPIPELTPTADTKRWRKPIANSIKCNVASSWISVDRPCGVSWILRDSSGAPIMHSRRAYLYIRSKEEANLYAMLWAVESMGSLHKHNVLFEASEIETRNIMMEPYLVPHLQHLVSSIIFKLDGWSLNHIIPECNSVAVAITTSVTTKQRYQSYVSAKGLAWLSHIISNEATS